MTFNDHNMIDDRLSSNKTNNDRGTDDDDDDKSVAAACGGETEGRRDCDGKTGTTTRRPDEIYTVLAFYKFQRVDERELTSLQQELGQLLRSRDAMGNVLLATEGINGTVCYYDHGESDDDPIQQYLIDTFPYPMMRKSYSSTNVFWRLRVRIKSEVVTMGVQGLSLVGGSGRSDIGASVDDDRGVAVCEGEGQDHENSGDSSCWGCGTGAADAPGKYVSPHDWNDLVKDPTTLVIDTRNEYEVQVGTFEGAVNPHTSSFVEFPSWLENQLQLRQSDDDNQPNNDNVPPPAIRTLAFFCTGGVRCEKATAYAQRLLLLSSHQGRGRSGDGPSETGETTNTEPQSLPEVVHLQGGILAYLEAVPPQDSLFRGECYVFDNRVAVSHGLRPTDQYQACRACRHPLSTKEMEEDQLYLEGRQCRYCANDPDRQLRRDRYEMRHQQVVAAERKGCQHLGTNSDDALRAKHRAQIKAAEAATSATVVAAATCSP